MEYQLLVSPDLALTPADIAAAWNADAQARTVAIAHLTPSPAPVILTLYKKKYSILYNNVQIGPL